MAKGSQSIWLPFKFHYEKENKMNNKKIWKRISAMVMAVAVAVPAGIGSEGKVDAAESIVANGTFDQNGEACTTGWSLGKATQSAAPAQTINLVTNSDFESGNTNGWTIPDSVTLSVVDDSEQGKVMKTSNVTGTAKIETDHFTIPEGVTSVTVSAKMKIEGTSEAGVMLAVLDEGNSTPDKLCSNIKSTDNKWVDYSITHEKSGDAKVYFRIQLTKKVAETPVCIDDVKITYEQASGTLVYSDGILLDGTDYAMKLSNGNSATYNASLTAGTWYEYSYDVHSDSAQSGFKAGFKAGNTLYTETSGMFKATEGMTVGFATKGTGVAYFDNLSIVPHTHNYTQTVQNNTTLASAATCTDPAYYYEYCEGCKELGTKTYPVGDPAGHDKEHHAYQAAKCTEDGNVEYWYCKNCQTKFSDEACTQTITDVVLTKHTQQHMTANPNSCTSDGNVEYWLCSCGEKYADQACTKKISDTEIKLDKHTQAHIERVEAKCTEDGNVEYWQCSCGENYKDEACTQKITAEEIKLAKHTQTHVVRVEANCRQDGNVEYWLCSCGVKYANEACTQTIEDDAITLKKHTQTHVEKKAATTAKDGNSDYYACECGKWFRDKDCMFELNENDLVIAKIKSITLATTSYTYDGKVKTPAVVVKDSAGKTLVKDTDYKLTYAAGRKKVGKYTVKVTFTGDYSGTKSLSFTINPKGTTLKSVKAGSKKFTASWKKQATETTGYEIRYATNSKMKSAKTVNISKKTKTSYTKSKLGAKKKYYVQIRTYKKVGNTKFYSAWSKTKTVKTKK